MAYRNVIQTNFSWGEISPLAEARVDLAQYPNAAKTAENFHAIEQGGVIKRPGTKQILDIGAPTHIRKIPFSPSSTDNYVLVFVPTYIYIFKNGTQVRTYPVTKVTTIARTGNVATATSAAHGYSDDNYVTIAGANQADYNGIFRITNVTANTFDYIVQNAPVTPATGSITSAVGVAVSITNPYAGADIANVKYEQKNDVIYLTHKSYQQRKISRTSDTAWTISIVVFDPPPTVEDTFDLSNTKSVTSITRSGATATATVTAHGYGNNNYVTIAGATQTEYNGTFLISNVTANTFDYTVSGTPDTPATGTITCNASTLKPYATTGDGIVIIAGDNIFYSGDEGRIITYGTAEATIVSVEAIAEKQDSAVKTISSLTRSSYTATATSTAHGFSNGDKITILGANQDAYNGTFVIANVAANTFDYTLDSKPVKPATGTIVCYKSLKSLTVTGITRSSSVATATVTGHGYADGDTVKIKGANQTEYNGQFVIYNVETDTFDYTVTGTPATPATGTMHAILKSPTNVAVVDILVDFANTDPIAGGAWKLKGSPQAEITLSSRGPVGSIVTVTADQAVFRSADVDKYIKTIRADGSNAIYRITKFKDKKKVKAKVLVKLQNGDSLTIIKNAWTLEIETWSSTRGYPAAIAFYQGRLYYGGSTAQPSTGWGSEVDGYENFGDGSKADNALTFTLDSSGLHEIRWMKGARSLIMGTVSGEWEVKGSSDTGITPSNILARNHSNYGSNNIVPVRVGNEILFVDRTGKKIRAMAYDFDSDSYLSPDLTLLAEHITTGGIVDMAYQQAPYPIVYMVRADGVLLAMLYNKEQKIVAISRYVMTDSALFKNVAVIPHPDGDRDQVWVTTKRGSNYHIEILEDEGYYGNISVDNAFVHDGASISKIIGLARFNTKTVNIVVDGLKQTSQVVASGTVDISPAGTKIEIGLPFTATLKTLRPEIQTETGSRQGKKLRLSEIHVRLYNTIKLKIEGTAVDSLGNTQFTGDVRVANLGWDRDGNISITHDEPYPCTILGIISNLAHAD